MTKVEMKYLTEEQIKEIETKIGYTFKNKNLLSSAFRRKSYTEEQQYGALIPNNEILEFYGDSALNLIVVKALAKQAAKSFAKNRRPMYNEEALTHFVSNYTDKDMLSTVIKEMDISKYLITGNGDVEKEVHKSISVMEDLFEALVGAMWFDNDLDIDAIYDTTIKMLDLKIDTSEFYEKNEYVQLKEFIDRNPDYSFVKKEDMFCLNYKGEFLEELPRFESDSINRYEQLICAAHYGIEFLKETKKWDIPDEVPTEGITEENVINKLQELYQKKVIYLNPIYSDGKFDRERNLWLVDCTFPSEKYPVTHTGEAKTKTEAKKKAALAMYMDIAKNLND